MSELAFPHPFTPQPVHRAGRMMAAGRVKVTLKDLTSGEHITVLYKSFADNRQRQYKENLQTNWVPCPLVDCTHLFCEVPNQSGWNDKVGTYYPKTGRWYDADNADPQRIEAAKLIAAWLVYPVQVNEKYPNHTFQEAEECGVCGRELTDPESIARGIGPVCFGQLTESHHQVKDLDAHREAKTEVTDAADATWTPAFEQQVLETPTKDLGRLAKRIVPFRVDLGVLTDEELCVLSEEVAEELVLRKGQAREMREEETVGAGDLLGR